MREQPALVVFSHLRWDFVYQRPQHLLSRLARGRRVLFIEEPWSDESAEPRWQRSSPEPGVLVCRPLMPVRTPGFSDDQLPVLEGLVQRLLQEEGLDDYVIWF